MWREAIRSEVFWWGVRLLIFKVRWLRPLNGHAVSVLWTPLGGATGAEFRRRRARRSRQESEFPALGAGAPQESSQESPLHPSSQIAPRPATSRPTDQMQVA